MLRSRKNLIGIVQFIIFVVALYLILKVFLLPTVNSVEFQEFTQRLGIFGYFIVIGYIVLSHVFAPIAGTPGVALGVTIYGMGTGMSLLYVASLISATINFYISRVFGREWVTRLAGKKSMRKIDDFVEIEGNEVLVVGRLFGFALFDFISYAAGLTSIKFKNYFLITAVIGLIPNLVMRLVFKNIDFGNEMEVVIWMSSIFVMAIASGFLLKLYVGKKKST